MPRLLFSSYHCYLDPSSGAALSTRDLLELLTSRSWDCPVFCGSRLDLRSQGTLAQIVSDCRVPVEVRRYEGSILFSLHHLKLNGIPITVYEPERTQSPVPGHDEGMPFLALLERLLDTFQPEIMLTYGGSWLACASMALARRKGVRVVFCLHNFAYDDVRIFRDVDGVIVPSRFAQEHYRRLGLTTIPLPGPFQLERIVCPEVEGRYVTFINPEPTKGVFVFARIAHELGRRRPDIPLLVVESRGTVDWLARTGLDFQGNLHRMANTLDPRDFYRVSRLVLMPSLWNESLGRVAIEAMLNGIPVLASTRGALPEVLEQTGLLLDIPAHYTPQTHQVPTADEVAPWIDAIIHLWDDPSAYAAQQQRCLTAATAWHPAQLLPRFDAFLRAVLAGKTYALPR